MIMCDLDASARALRERINLGSVIRVLCTGVEEFAPGISKIERHCVRRKKESYCRQGLKRSLCVRPETRAGEEGFARRRRVANVT